MPQKVIPVFLLQEKADLFGEGQHGNYHRDGCLLQECGAVFNHGRTGQNPTTDGGASFCGRGRTWRRTNGGRLRLGFVRRETRSAEIAVPPSARVNSVPSR